jgi:hypothetical protein
MRAVTDQISSNDAYFLIKFINRPFCVFKCDYGHVGYRNKQSRILECSKSLFTLFTLEEPDDATHSEGIVYLKGLKNSSKKHEISLSLIFSNRIRWTLLGNIE